MEPEQNISENVNNSNIMSENLSNVYENTGTVGENLSNVYENTGTTMEGMVPMEETTSMEAPSMEETTSMEVPPMEETTSMEAPPMEETAPVEETLPMENMPTAAPKGKPVRSTKQREADAGQAEMLARLREMYNEDFADIPVNMRPKAKAWVARAAYYKPTDKEREDYIADMMKADRNAMTSNNSGSASNSRPSMSSNSSTKQKLRSMITGMEVTVDKVLETATVAIVGSATTRDTKKAARKFVRELSNTTRKFKSSLRRELTKSVGNSPNMNLPVNGNSASSNSGVVRNNSLAANNSAAANNRSSLNINLSRMRMNSPLQNSNDRSYERVMRSIGKTRKRGRYSNNNNSNNNSSNSTNVNSPYKKRAKMPMSNYMEI